MIINEIDTLFARQKMENEKKLPHAKALLTKERRPVTMLVDIESSCNVLQKGYCRKHGLVTQHCKKELIDFNASTNFVVGMVEVLISIRKWKVLLLFYVLDLGTTLLRGTHG